MNFGADIQAELEKELLTKLEMEMGTNMMGIFSLEFAKLSLWKMYPDEKERKVQIDILIDKSIDIMVTQCNTIFEAGKESLGDDFNDYMKTVQNIMPELESRIRTRFNFEFYGAK